MRVVTTEECAEQWLKVLSDNGNCVYHAACVIFLGTMRFGDEMLTRAAHGQDFRDVMECLDLSLNLLCYVMHGEAIMGLRQGN